MLKHSLTMSYLPVRIMLKNSKKFQWANVLGTCVHAAILHDKRLVSCALYRFAILRRE